MLIGIAAIERNLRTALRENRDRESRWGFEQLVEAMDKAVAALAEIQKEG